MTLPATITHCGGIRSAMTPPARVKTMDGVICAARTYERSAVDPVAYSTANDTPTSENANANGASSRSASSSRKSRYPSTGKRRTSARADMADFRSWLGWPESAC